MTTFPPHFLWGASTAGHQVEGGNVNADMWPLEWAQDSMFTEPSGDACDHYHRYPEDLGILADLGFNAYRFSLEWSRIEPEPGYFSRAELDHYRRMVGACRDHGLEPVVTYNHFTTPRWFAGSGGWRDSRASDRFARYAARVTDHLGDLLTWVATLNEPNLFTLLTQTGAMPTGVGEPGLVADPGKPITGIGGFDPASYRMGFIGAAVDRMALVHRKAVEAIKSGPGDAVVGWTLALPDLQLAEGGEARFADVRRRALVDWIEVSREDDFIGVQTYSRERIGPAGVEPIPDGTPTMQTGWEVYPDALGNTVRLAAEHGRVPVLVTENGMATDDDRARIDYTSAALDSLAQCLDDGIDVRGYLHWTLLDNFEWISGFSKTFGLIAVDRESLVRTIKPSARWLGRVARSNGEDLGVHS
jgi:beta-glucosidase